MGFSWCWFCLRFRVFNEKAGDEKGQPAASQIVSSQVFPTSSLLGHRLPPPKGFSIEAAWKKDKIWKKKEEQNLLSFLNHRRTKHVARFWNLKFGVSRMAIYAVGGGKALPCLSLFPDIIQGMKAGKSKGIYPPLNGHPWPLCCVFSNLFIGNHFHPGLVFLVVFCTPVFEEHCP